MNDVGIRAANLADPQNNGSNSPRVSCPSVRRRPVWLLLANTQARTTQDPGPSDIKADFSFTT